MSKDLKSELLLPVGNMEMCLAAIHNGADAIYVGVPEFNARGRSVDHSLDELKEMIELCHLYGVKVNLAFNVVIFEEEIESVVDLIYKVIPLSPDAIIVQDLGLIKIIKEIAPDQVIHASTQMTVTNFEAMELLSDLKIKRFVLGREVSITEISKIKEKTNEELEVFVHGALCVAYSGQCFTSESIGGRSANRGQCAQSCRFEYEMKVDGIKRDLIDQKYLVSPQDLCGIAEIPFLCDLKIKSFKVEGRLKSPEYVASTAMEYRKAIDLHLNNKKITNDFIDEAKHKMGLTYSRGFYSGWLHGVDHQELVNATYSAHRGNLIGKVLKKSNKSIIITTNVELKNGDGILLASTKSNKKIEEGGKIFSIKKLSKENFEISLGAKFDYNKIDHDFDVYINSDVKLFHELKKTYEDRNIKKRISISINVQLNKGMPLRCHVVDSDGNEVEVYSSENCELSHNNQSSLVLIKEELSSLSNTIFSCKKMTINGDENIFIHQKELKNIRRHFTSLLHEKRLRREKIQLFPFKKGIRPVSFNKTNPKLNILLRNADQVKYLVDFKLSNIEKIGVVYLDFEFGRDYKNSVDLLRSSGFKVGIATTRILKPNEYHNFKLIERSNPDVILVRNLGALYYFRNSHFILKGDFSLNVTNSFSYNYLLSKKLKTICASYDLNDIRLKKLAESIDPHFLEVTLHQYMPSFHMEHCVFAAFLSKGSSYRDCGKPCEKHQVELVDQFKNHHFIKADQECRNTMFNAEAQSGLLKVKDWRKLGLSEFRFEALNEDLNSLRTKISTYLEVIEELDNENFSPEFYFKKVGAIEKYGIGEGSISKVKDHRDRKKN